MSETIFKGLFDSDMSAVISVYDFLLCVACSLLIGLILAAGYCLRGRYTKSFAATLIMLPAVVCVVIMMVNGNIGAGVAVAGAFSLVRFRSIPGSAMEISMLFLAMGSGLVAGMGYLGFALLFAVIMGLLSMLISMLDLGAEKKSDRYKTLNIAIPEDLDYTGVFEPVLEKYAESSRLVKVKTANMGSIFRLSYELVLKRGCSEKQLMDELRCRNGNLEISLCRRESTVTEL